MITLITPRGRIEVSDLWIVHRPDGLIDVAYRVDDSEPWHLAPYEPEDDEQDKPED